jgi:uncharacterized membrane protein
VKLKTAEKNKEIVKTLISSVEMSFAVGSVINKMSSASGFILILFFVSSAGTKYK